MQRQLPLLQFAGCTKTTVDAYILLQNISQQAKAEIVAEIYHMIVQGKGQRIFSFSNENNDEHSTYLVNAEEHFLVQGNGHDRSTFVEQRERLTFFLKPSFALPLEHPVCLRRLSPETYQELHYWFKHLQRDANYTYMLDKQLITLVSSTRQKVEVSMTFSHSVWHVEADIFWHFVFSGEQFSSSFDDRAEISVAHAAQLLGLSALTLSRRIAEGKLPAVRAFSHHPGVTRQGIEKYLEYRRLFPQGCISPQQTKRWKQWKQQWQQGQGNESF